MNSTFCVKFVEAAVNATSVDKVILDICSGSFEQCNDWSCVMDTIRSLEEDDSWPPFWMELLIGWALGTLMICILVIVGERKTIRSCECKAKDVLTMTLQALLWPLIVACMLIGMFIASIAHMVEKIIDYVKNRGNTSVDTQNMDEI